MLFALQTYAAYHDEHSAPFSWRTRSQQNLLFDVGPQFRDGDILSPIHWEIRNNTAMPHCFLDNMTF